MSSDKSSSVEDLKNEAEQLRRKLYEERKKLDDAESMYLNFVVCLLVLVFF